MRNQDVKSRIWIHYSFVKKFLVINVLNEQRDSDNYTPLHVLHYSIFLMYKLTYARVDVQLAEFCKIWHCRSNTNNILCNNFIVKFDLTLTFLIGYCWFMTDSFNRSHSRPYIKDLPPLFPIPVFCFKGFAKAYIFSMKSVWNFVIVIWFTS